MRIRGKVKKEIYDNSPCDAERFEIQMLILKTKWVANRRDRQKTLTLKIEQNVIAVAFYFPSVGKGEFLDSYGQPPQLCNVLFNDFSIYNCSNWIFNAQQVGLQSHTSNIVPNIVPDIVPYTEPHEISVVAENKVIFKSSELLDVGNQCCYTFIMCAI